VSDVSYMANSFNGIAGARKRLGLTQQQLAEKVGTHWITISKLERGKQQLTRAWIDKLSGALGIGYDELLGSGPLKPSHQIEVVSSLRGDLVERIEPPDAVEIIRREPNTGYWLRVGDESWKPFFLAGDLVRFSLIANVSVHAVVGRLVLVEDLDGAMVAGVLEDVEPYRPPPVPFTTINGREVKWEAPALVHMTLLQAKAVKRLAAANVYVFDGAQVFWPTKKVE
jgi:transcriptional regulator with XRE-family HTH domain